MKLPKKILTTYNQANSLIMITPYPPKGVTYGKGIGGLASYAKNTMMSLARKLKSSQRKVIILTQKESNGEEYYIENGILVVRCFERDTFRLYAQLINTLHLFNEVKQVAIQFEFAAYGGFVIASLFPILLSALRAEGKKVSVVLHQVVSDLSSLSGHIGLNKGSLQLTAFNWLLKMYYQILGLVSHTIVTLEETLAERLKTIIYSKNEEAVMSIPHGVDTSRPTLTQSAARKKLGLAKNELVLVSFGYLTWYKGTDLLIKALPQIQKIVGNRPVRLILAGGPSETQADKKHYQKFLTKVDSLAASNPAVTITGFVKDSQIGWYYSAADLVLLPYRSYMSSSGPLSLAYTYKKPFILSEQLSNVLAAPDYQEALSDLQLKSSEVITPTQPAKLAKHIVESTTKSQIKKLTQLSVTMRNKRAYSQQATAFEQAFFANDSLIEASLFGVSKTTFTKWYSKIALPTVALVTSTLLSKS